MSCMSGDGPLGWRTLGGMDNYEKKIITITLIVELTFPKKNNCSLIWCVCVRVCAYFTLFSHVFLILFLTAQP